MTAPAPRSTTRSPVNWRKLHRWLGIGAAVLFLLVSATGVALQVQQLFGDDEGDKEAMAAVVSPMSLARPVLVDAAALERARTSVLGRFGDRRVSNVEWQIKGPVPQYVFHLDGAEPLRVSVNAASGTILDSRADGEGWLIKLHTGEIVGDGGKVVGLAWGLGLVFMTLSGAWLYVKMYRARQKGSAASATGLRRWFW